MKISLHILLKNLPIPVMIKITDHPAMCGCDRIHTGIQDAFLPDILIQKTT